MSELNLNGSDAAGRGLVRRRTIVKGAAWSLPVIAAATAVPLATASPNTGTISFDKASYTTGPGGTYEPITGVVMPGTGQALPSEVSLTYPAGFSGPAVALVDPVTGKFTVTGVTSPASTSASALLTASANSYTPGSTQLLIGGGPNPPVSGPALVWGYNTMNGTGGGNRPYAAVPQKVVDAGWSVYRDVAQVGDEATYLVSPDGLTLTAFRGSSVTPDPKTIALEPGETIASLAGGLQIIALITTTGRILSAPYTTDDLGVGSVRNPAGVAFLQVAQLDSDTRGVVGLSVDGKVHILNSTGTGNTYDSIVKLADGSDLTDVVEIAAGRRPRIVARKSDGTVWSVYSLGGTSSSNQSYAQQVWAGAEGMPLTATQLSISTNPYTDSGYFTAAIGTDGLIWVWGDRTNELDGTTSNVPYARSIDVIGALGLAGVTVKNVSVGAVVYATLSDGRVVSFGSRRDEGEAGQGPSAMTGNKIDFVVDVNGVPISGINRVAVTRGGGWAIEG